MPTISTSSRRTAAVLALLAVLLAGCRTTAQTTVTVTSVSTARIDVVVTFDGPAARAAGRTDLRERLQEVFANRIGRAPTVTTDDGLLTFSAKLTADELTDSADLLGVRAVTLAPDGTTTTATLELVYPDRLGSAVVAAVADEPDAAVLASAVGGSTWLTATVVLPGGVVEVSADDRLPVEVTETAAVVAQPLAEYQPGTLAVTGDPHGPPSWPWWAAAAAAAAAGVVVVGRWQRRPVGSR